MPASLCSVQSLLLPLLLVGFRACAVPHHVLVSFSADNRKNSWSWQCIVACKRVLYVFVARMVATPSLEKSAGEMCGVGCHLPASPRSTKHCPCSLGFAEAG